MVIPTRRSELPLAGFSVRLLAEGGGDATPLPGFEQDDWAPEAGCGERSLAERLRKDGYVQAQVLREYFIPSESREADVILRVESGPRVRVGEVRIVGSGEIGDEVIQELLRFQSGDWFSGDRILESQRSLYDLQALRWANIQSERRTDTDTLIDLRVEVAPAPKRSLQAGAGDRQGSDTFGFHPDLLLRWVKCGSAGRLRLHKCQKPRD